MKAKHILAMASLLAVASCQTPNPLQVRTQQGIVEGVQLDEQVRAYLGVPFAEPPVGNLRWTAPKPHRNWDGVLQTKKFGPDPVQLPIFGDMAFRGDGQSEDCLYLNIWTSAKSDKDSLPVLIYFNGGGLFAGSGSEPRYDGASIAREGVIGITANYREGIFGFFAHPSLTAESGYNGSGNYGFLDQAMAIQWVRDNIVKFGGDPNRINIVGESAGSFSVSLLMCSPLSKNNIAGALLSSGAEVLPLVATPLKDAENEGVGMLESRNIGGIEDARSISADSLQKLFPPSMKRVVIDGYFMTEPADSVFIKGKQAQVPLLAGWNSLEGVPSSPTLEGYKNQMRNLFGDMTDEIFEAYGIKADKDVMQAPGFTLASDLFTGFPTWKVCDYHATTSNQPVYRYKFNHPRPRVSAKMGNKTAALAGGVRDKTEEEKNAEEQIAPGAVHSADIEYAMGNLRTNEYYDWTDDDYEISRVFITYYANFCKNNGDPNGPSVPKWTPINGKLDNAPVMQIDVKTEEVSSSALENAYRTLEKFYKNRTN